MVWQEIFPQKEALWNPPRPRKSHHHSQSVNQEPRFPRYWRKDRTAHPINIYRGYRTMRLYPLNLLQSSSCGKYITVPVQGKGKDLRLTEGLKAARHPAS